MTTLGVRGLTIDVWQTLVGLGKCEHITPVLCDALHWLPVPQRIQFKIATLTFDCVQVTGPAAYFSSIACTVTDN